MKILLAACNAKYIHSNLAVYDLQAYASDYADHIVLKEYTINQQKDDIMRDIYLEHPDVSSLKKFIAIKNKHIILHEQNAFTSHLMLDSNEIYNLTKQGLNAAQIAALKRIHPNLVLVKLLELYRMGYDFRHYYAQHHAFIECFKLPAHFRFDSAQAV